MFYYYVWVRSNKYHGREPLTYASEERLPVGTLVRVELQNILVSGFISSRSEEPKFKTKVISEVLDLPPLPNVQIKLANWMINYYPSPLGMITQQFIPSTIKLPNDLILPTLNSPNISKLPPLTEEQKVIVAKLKSTDHYILRGVTGSGKTRVYQENAISVFSRGKSVILLTPEISLTTQLEKLFKTIFGDQVLVTHSNQTTKERQLTWLKCLMSNEPLILIGPRSALFAPLKNIGLIIMDESHENAYKQEQSPQYLTSRVAAKLALLTKSSLVLGSATPLITDYYLAKAKNRSILKMSKLAKTSIFKKPSIEIIDLKNKEAFNRSNIISEHLLQGIEIALEKNQQVLLYLNRRGTARLILCQNCGWQALCPNCDVALTYHGDSHNLVCHSCSYSSVPPVSCPVCGYIDIVFKSAGTKALADEIKKLFPKAAVGRFDSDNIKSDSFLANYSDIVSGRINIVIGTQLIAKGLDLPNLSLVGVILADTSLYLPDFSSQERTFQLITQVIGRIGRGHNEGSAIIQTYNPESPIINYAASAKYEAFYKSEITHRKNFYFPPFCYLLKLTIRRASTRSAKKTANEIKADIIAKHKVIVEGPSPAFHERNNNKFQWQLVVKSASRTNLVDIVSSLPPGVLSDLDPLDLL